MFEVLLGMALGMSAVQGPSIVPPSAGAVLVDTRCEDREWASAARTAIGGGHVLLAQQDDRSLYLCILLPADSYGTMDLYVQPEARTIPPTNLHASAQVGERQWTGTSWPDWSFGNHQGWYSPPVALASSTFVDGKPRLVFGAVTAREVAIEKSKFGGGPWRFMLELRALGADKTGRVRYPANASPDDPAGWASLSVVAPAVSPPGSEALTLSSAILGEQRTVWIGAPTACRQRDCDLLVVLDAHALYPIATAYAGVMQAMGRMEPLIVVGVPSPSQDARVRDFTTAAGADERARYPQAGGGARFLEFLEREVLPAISTRYRLSARRALAGHSLAGLFAVTAMASNAGFDSYAAISPTLGWNREHALNTMTPLLGDRAKPKRRLYVSVANDAPAYLSAFARLEADITRAKSSWLDASFERFGNEDHVTTVAPALQRAIQRLFAKQP